MAGSLVRRRQLARRLRSLREAAGLSIEQAAPKLDWSTSKLSRIETAQQMVDVHGVRSMLDLYDVGGPCWTELVDLARAARRRGWWRDYGLDDMGYVPLEAEASLVRTFQPLLVPGLLQTPAYTRAIFETALLHRRTRPTLENSVAVRERRQQRLTAEADGLELVAVVDESVLRRTVGHREVMRTQLAHLLAAAALPRVTLQVLPPLYAGVDAGFALLDFGDLSEPDIAYLEHASGAVHIDTETDVREVTIAFDSLRAAALGPDASLGVIERVLRET